MTKRFKGVGLGIFIGLLAGVSAFQAHGRPTGLLLESEQPLVNSEPASVVTRAPITIRERVSGFIARFWSEKKEPVSSSAEPSRSVAQQPQTGEGSFRGVAATDPSSATASIRTVAPIDKTNPSAVKSVSKVSGERPIQSSVIAPNEETRSIVQSIQRRIGSFFGYFAEERRIDEIEARSREAVRNAENEIQSKTRAQLLAESQRQKEVLGQADREAQAAARAEEEDRRAIRLAETAEQRRIRTLEAKIDQVKLDSEIRQVARRLGGFVEKYVKVTLAMEETEDDSFENLQSSYVDQCNSEVRSTLQRIRFGLKVTEGDLNLLRVRTALYGLANELTTADREVGRSAWTDLQAIVASGESHDTRFPLVTYVAYSRTIVGDSESRKRLQKLVKQIRSFDSVTAAVLENRTRSPAAVRRR